MKREIEEDDVVIMNFSGIYSLEKFAKDNRFKVLDCHNLQGTDGYCDAEAEKYIKRLLRPLSCSGIHFLDSGDYHYMTKFWTDKIERPFNLLIFDHHTDLQDPAFGDILSCGGWIKQVLKTNKYLQKVILAGPPAAAAFSLPIEFRDRIVFHPETELIQDQRWREYIGQENTCPVYISIDKDILLKRECPTNWDQGNVSMSLLEDMLDAIFEEDKVIGIDICGECASSLDFLEKRKEATRNNLVNIEILKTILQDMFKTSR